MSDDLSRTRSGRSIWESVWRGIKFNRLLFQGQKLPQIVTSQVYISRKRLKMFWVWRKYHQVTFVHTPPGVIHLSSSVLYSSFSALCHPTPEFPRQTARNATERCKPQKTIYGSIIRENGDINEIAAADIHQQQTN